MVSTQCSRRTNSAWWSSNSDQPSAGRAKERSNSKTRFTKVNRPPATVTIRRGCFSGSSSVGQKRMIGRWFSAARIVKRRLRDSIGRSGARHRSGVRLRHHLGPRHRPPAGSGRYTLRFVSSRRSAVPGRRRWAATNLPDATSRRCSGFDRRLERRLTPQWDRMQEQSLRSEMPLRP